MYTKKFSQELFNQYDKIAKDKVLEITKQNPNFVLKEPDDKYKTDLEIHHMGIHKQNLEVEVRTSWIGYRWPHPDVQVICRKEKNNDGHSIHLIFNNDLSRHLCIKYSDIVKCRVVSHINKFSKGQEEQSYSVPLELCNFDYLYKMIDRPKSDYLINEEIRIELFDKIKERTLK